MNYEGLFRQVREHGIELSFDHPHQAPPSGLSNEALFHLPLLAVTILMLSKGKRKPRVDELGQIVGECFERTFVGFKGSSQHLGWSANLRVRTVRALTFLETAGLISTDTANNTISATPRGRDVIDTALDSETDLSFTLRVIERSYRNVSVEKQISLALE